MVCNGQIGYHILPFKLSFWGNYIKAIINKDRLLVQQGCLIFTAGLGDTAKISYPNFIWQDNSLSFGFHHGSLVFHIG